MIQRTSRKAYLNEIAPTRGPRQILVLEAMDRLGEATNKELARALEWEINTVTPRTNELVKALIVEEVARRPCKITGRMAIVWAIRGSGGGNLGPVAPVRVGMTQTSSRTDPRGSYQIRQVGDKLMCSCKGFQFRDTCVHVREARVNPELVNVTLGI